MEQPDWFLTEKTKAKYEEAEKGYLDRSEYVNESDKTDRKIPSQKNNFRQIDIFMEEMLPGLKARLHGPNPPTACVLAPFRLQLALLKERLEKELSKELELSEDTDLDSGLPSLSIHKAQGKGYDIVYVMTVEDDHKSARAPWGQNMRIINVAVSRAKKELHVITSRIWIPRYIQRKLPGFEKASPLPYCVKKFLAAPDEEKEKAFYHNWTWEKGEKKYLAKENLYIGRLCQWVYDNWGAQEQHNRFGRFGFHRAGTRRLFDSFDAPHERLRQALTDARPDLDKDAVWIHVSLANAPRLAGELPRVKTRKNMSAVERTPFQDGETEEEDFIFVCRGNRIRAVIHVLDGEYRDACREKYGFYKRLACRIGRTCAADKYIAVPTNGGFDDVVEKILELYDRSRDNLTFSENPDEGNPVTRLLKDRTRECLDAVGEALDQFRSAGTGPEEKAEIRSAIALNYGRASDVTYSQSALGRPLTQQYYLCRYGTAYAFEYALMYDMVFSCAKAKELRILSLGCGSCIDALAAAYSSNRLGEDRTLTYTGVDRVRWDVSFLDVHGESDGLREYFEETEFIMQDIVGYFEESGHETLDSNVIFFPKILNELDRAAQNRLLAAAGKCRLDPGVEEYYFCVSHSRSAVEKDKENGRFPERFIDALRNHEQYSYSGSVFSFFDFERDEGFRNRWGLTGENMLTDQDGVCQFRRGRGVERKIQKLNADFSDLRTDEEMKKAIEDLKQTDADAENIFRHRITRVNEIAFQIIRLQKPRGTIPGPEDRRGCPD